VDPDKFLQLLHISDGITLSLTFDGVTYTQLDESRCHERPRRGSAQERGVYEDDNRDDDDSDDDGGHHQCEYPFIALSFGHIDGVDWRVDDWKRHKVDFAITPFFFFGRFGFDHHCQSDDLEITIP